LGRGLCVAALCAGAVVGCGSGSGKGSGLSNPEIGGAAWKQTDVKCKADADCLTGETCGDGVCQMKRCGEPNYKSLSPLGSLGYFSRDRELVVAGDDVRAFDPSDRVFVPKGTPTASRVLDVAGGNLMGTRPEAVASISNGNTSVRVKGPSVDKSIPLTFMPTAIAAGDVDADEADEIVAVSRTGQLALCKAQTGKCETMNATPPAEQGAAPFEVLDVTVADVDGDGFAEAVLLAKNLLVVVNFDTAATGNKKILSYPLDKELVRLSSADMDGDGTDDLVGYDDGWTGDDLFVYSLKGGTLKPLASLTTSNGAVDVVAGMFGRQRPEIGLVRSDGTMEMFTLDGAGKLATEYKSALPGVGNALRVAVADVDGDSPSRKLVAEPKLVPGNVVPVAVLTLPPYSRTYSDGRSNVTMGRRSEQSEAKKSGTIFSVEAGIGFETEFSVPLVKVVSFEIEAHYRQESWKFREQTTTVASSVEFEVEARPEMEGFDSGAVVVGCGCYHKYDYKLDDPAGKLGLGANGKVFSLFVPVGAQTTVWSTRRYNAMAEALGGKLPKVTIPYQLGQVASYPKSPQTLDGRVIPTEEMVFGSPPTLRVSDVAATRFELSVAREEVNEQWLWRGVGGSVTVGVFGINLSGSVDVNWGKGYSLAVSEETSFSGEVPPMRNNPNTPEDELKINGYSFTPILYRHKYKDADGKDGAFFALTYAVGK
jgi:hypothetical protein